MTSKTKYPLGLKFAIIILAMGTLIGALIVFVSYQVYSSQNYQRYVDQGNSLESATSKYVDWDKIDYYLATGQTDEEYDRTLSTLRAFSDAAGAEYLFILKPTPAGAIYVYDSDTSEDRVGLGEFLAWDDEFAVQSDALVKGQEIDPVTTNGEYGRLLSIYKPMFDSSGEFVAYIGLDFSVEQLSNQASDFIQRLVIVAIASTLVMTVLFVFFVRRAVVKPINKIAHATDSYLNSNEEEEEEAAESLMCLDINTHDEIQSLSRSLKHMVGDIDQHIEDLEEANRRAASDPLTGLLNREAFREQASAQIVHDHSNDLHIFIMLDLDNFKQINDTRGHSKGDEVLLACSQAIKSHFRGSDLVSRMGGDEFAIFYKSMATLSDIEERAEQIRTAIKKIIIDEDITTSASIGISFSSARDNYSYQRLYILADEAMYEAKANGRDTFVINAACVNQRRRKDD